MKKMILLFIVLLCSIWAGLQISHNPGYVLVALSHWTVEAPLWFMIIIIILAYLIFYILMRILKNMGLFKHLLYNWRAQYRAARSQRRTRIGLIEFSEGNWEAAEHNLIKAIPSGENALINYLAAARAAQEQGAPNRRDQYLRAAQCAMPDAKIAVELTQAQLQISYDQWEQALATLKHLHSLAPHHPYVIKLLLKVYLSLKDWNSMASILNVIKRKKIIDEKDFEKLEFNTYEGLLEQAAKKDGLNLLQKVWHGFPTAIKRQPQLIAVYVKYLLDKKDDLTAEGYLTAALKQHLENNLIDLYGRCQGKNPSKQLTFAENLLKQQPNNPTLLLALGKICIRNQLWGKAKTYLNNSAQLAPKLETYVELAKLLEQLGETAAAAEYYKKGIDLALISSTRLHEKPYQQATEKMYLEVSKLAI